MVWMQYNPNIFLKQVYNKHKRVIVSYTKTIAGKLKSATNYFNNKKWGKPQYNQGFPHF